MPQLRTYNDGKHIYSVDMMLAYLNTVVHPKVKLEITALLDQLQKTVWDTEPMSVLKQMDAKKYKSDAERIRKANLAYPIIVTSKHVIVDGYHRVARTYMEGIKTIDAHVFDAALMRKFILVKGMDFAALNKLNIFNILELWTKRFC
jgi:disulfide oxidoreductase YuzD